MTPDGGGAGRLAPDALGGIVDESLDGVVVFTSEGCIVYASATAGRILGYAPGDLLGRDVEDLVARPARGGVPARFGGSGPESTGRRLIPIVRADGVEREIECATTIVALDGSPVVAAMFADVTDTRRQEREARALARIAASMTLDQPLRATLDAMNHAALDATRAVAATIMLVEPDTLRMLEYTTRELPEAYVRFIERTWPLPIESPSVRAMRTRQLQVGDHARDRMLASPLFAEIHDLIATLSWESIVAAPLVWRGRVSGTMTSYFASPVPPQDGITVLAAIADQAAVVVENTRLYAEAQGRAALEERQRLARELHDSVSQALFGIGLGAQTALTWLERDPAQAEEPIQYVLELANTGQAEMRALIFELRPESLAQEGLVSALEKQAAALRARHRITVDVELDSEPVVPLPVKEALYRIAQEAMHNAVKHASPRVIRVRLACREDALTLEVSDDGAGFDATASFPGHLGLRSMPERAQQFGGTVTIDSAPGRGTRVRAVVPLLPERQQADI